MRIFLSSELGEGITSDPNMRHFLVTNRYFRPVLQQPLYLASTGENGTVKKTFSRPPQN